MTYKPVNYDVPDSGVGYICMTEEADSMGKRIARAMEIKGLKATDLARLVGVTRVTAGQWLHDTSEPRPENLLTLAAVLGTTPHYLVFGPSLEPTGGFPAAPGTSESGSFRSPISRRRRT